MTTAHEVDILVSSQARICVRDSKVSFNDVPQAPTNLDTDPLSQARTLARQRYILTLKRQLDHLVILCGAGTSVGVGVGDRVGKAMADLWSIVETAVGDFVGFCEVVQHDYESKDLERLLTQAHRASGLVKGDVDSTVRKIERIIRDKCALQLPEHSPHEVFLGKLVRRPLKRPRTRLFTLNYDTLFEQAANQAGITLIDGFSFGTPRTFNGATFDYDIVHRHGSRITGEANYLSRVLHLYKLHGSVDWCEDDKNRITRRADCDRPLMIFPRDTKFEHSYKQPFFEMFARLQQVLRQPNVLVVCIGVSFADSHIFTTLREAVSQNLSVQLLVVNRTIGGGPPWQWLRHRAQLDDQVILVAEDFADFVNHYPALSIGHGEYVTSEGAPERENDEPAG